MSKPEPKSRAQNLLVDPLLRLQLRRKKELKTARRPYPAHPGGEIQKDLEGYNRPADGEILRERARALARPVLDENAVGFDSTLVVLRLGNFQLALDIEFVREIIPLETITPVPGVPAFIAGVINSRGKILTLVEVETFLRDGPARREKNLSGPAKQTAVIIQFKNIEFGLLCDNFPVVDQYLAGSFKEIGSLVTDYRPEHLTGITSDGILLLDLASMVADRRFIVEQDG